MRGYLSRLSQNYLMGLQDRPRVLTCYKFRERCVCGVPGFGFAGGFGDEGDTRAKECRGILRSKIFQHTNS